MVDFVTNNCKFMGMCNDDFDLEDFLPYLLNQAAEAASRSFQHLYKERYGLLRTEWRVLFHLGMYGELTARAISTRASIHKTKISRAVASLETRRYLRRTTNPKDRREAVLTLTPAGTAVYQDLRQAAQGYDTALVAGWSKQTTQDLRKMLRDLAKRRGQTD
jgi:DNA-binding MarR family transcriptional regulator